MQEFTNTTMYTHHLLKGRKTLRIHTLYINIVYHQLVTQATEPTTSLPCINFKLTDVSSVHIQHTSMRDFAYLFTLPNKYLVALTCL